MLHHVGIEVSGADLEGSVRFWQLLGFRTVQPPAGLERFTWLEREGTQIHLMPTEAPTVPPRGHAAVVVPDFEHAVAALREAGFEVERRGEHWGAARAKAISPSGHLVELMAEPPPGTGGAA